MSRARRRWQLVRRLARRDPRVVADYLRLSLKGRAGRLEPARPAQAPEAIGLDEALEYVSWRGGRWSEGPALAGLRSSPAPAAELPAAEIAGAMATDPQLAKLAYSLTRAVRPQAVIETGVAGGLTSSYVLAALSDNGRGRLHSIDLPPPDLLMAEMVGCQVPPDLRGRWDYRLGASRRLLPRVLRATAGRRIFIHDSDHSYRNMRWELEQAWGELAAGDWILADDVNRHDAFAELAAAVGADPVFVSQSRPGGVTGLMLKP